jgi:hypothetical protein
VVVCGGCDVAATFGISIRIRRGNLKDRRDILTVVSAWKAGLSVVRRRCRSRCQSLGFKIPILRGGSSGAMLSEWSVHARAFGAHQSFYNV